MDKQLQYNNPLLTEELDLPVAEYWMRQAEFWRAVADHLTALNSELMAENERQAQLITNL
jgi:hypothetical protein